MSITPLYITYSTMFYNIDLYIRMPFLKIYITYFFRKNQHLNTSYMLQFQMIIAYGRLNCYLNVKMLYMLFYNRISSQI
jgi:hypothetical protein